MKIVAQSTVVALRDRRSVLETTTNRLREALAILETIDDGELLADLAPGEAGRRQQRAVSLLAVLARELGAVVEAQDELLGGL